MNPNYYIYLVSFIMWVLVAYLATLTDNTGDLRKKVIYSIPNLFMILGAWILTAGSLVSLSTSPSILIVFQFYGTVFIACIMGVLLVELPNLVDALAFASRRLS